MATAPEAQIPHLLMQKMVEFVHVPALPVAWPNMDFTPPSSGAWLEAAYLPNRNQNLFVGNGARTRHMGLLQVSVVSLQAEGLTPPQEIAGAVAAHFAKGTRLQSGALIVQIYEKPSVAAPYKDGKGWRTPVTVRWQAFA